VTADTAFGTDAQDVFLSVLPAARPADGPKPACQGTQGLIELSRFDANAWKRNHLSDVRLNMGVVFTNELGNKGLDMTFTDPPYCWFRCERVWTPGFANMFRGSSIKTHRPGVATEACVATVPTAMAASVRARSEFASS
jgi:hypothetical protein